MSKLSSEEIYDLYKTGHSVFDLIVDYELTYERISKALKYVGGPDFRVPKYPFKKIEKLNTIVNRRLFNRR